MLSAQLRLQYPSMAKRNEHVANLQCSLFISEIFTNALKISGYKYILYTQSEGVCKQVNYN